MAFARVCSAHLAVVASGVAFFFAAPALAQNTGGVSGPEVKRGDDSIEYRASYAPADGLRPSSFGHRLHYQHAFDDAWRLRLIVSQSRKGAGDLEFRSAALEAQWQFAEDEDTGWDGALNLQATIPDTDDGPGRLRLAWVSAVSPAEGWELRGDAYAAVDVGAASRDGLFLETRFEATREIAPALRIGGQLFSRYGSTSDFGSFNSQRHELGVILKGKLAPRLGYNFGALFGLSNAADDADLRLFLSYAL